MGAARARFRRPTAKTSARDAEGSEKRRTERVTVWLTPEEKKAFRLLANFEDLTDSTIGRNLIVGYLEKKRNFIEEMRAAWRNCTASG